MSAYTEIMLLLGNELVQIRVVLVQKKVRRSSVAVANETNSVNACAVRCDGSYAVIRIGCSKLRRMQYRRLPSNKTVRCTQHYQHQDCEWHKSCNCHRE